MGKRIRAISLKVAKTYTSIEQFTKSAIQNDHIFDIIYYCSKKPGVGYLKLEITPLQCLSVFSRTVRIVIYEGLEMLTKQDMYLFTILATTMKSLNILEITESNNDTAIAHVYQNRNLASIVSSILPIKIIATRRHKHIDLIIKFTSNLTHHFVKMMKLGKKVRYFRSHDLHLSSVSDCVWKYIVSEMYRAFKPKTRFYEITRLGEEPNDEFAVYVKRAFLRD